jgi:DNA-binding MarR family transcriptional regulator/GNAT superfamily N-acetyltransferase
MIVSTMGENQLDTRIGAYRSFNRFYTKKIGALSEGILGSGYSLAEARVLFEIASGADSASELCAELGLDPGYLSRMLRKFESEGLISRERSEGDGRRKALVLEPEGRRRFGELDERSRLDAARILGGLDEPGQRALVEAMGRIEGLLAGEGGVPRAPAFVIRDPRPGDFGWVLRAHASIYAREYGYGPDFEALVARIVADFASRRDGAKERCWIADLDGEPVGSVFLVKVDEETAKLRLLILEPRARGFGLGRRLVDECLRFARAAGYRKTVLWTNSALAAARSIYAAAGFSLVSSAPDPMFSDGSLSETWELPL